jgi:hypothetical protein
MFTNSERLLQKSSFAALRQKLPQHASMVASRDMSAYFSGNDGLKVDFEKGYDPTKSDLDDRFAENRIIVAGCQGQIGVPLV